MVRLMMMMFVSTRMTRKFHIGIIQFGLSAERRGNYRSGFFIIADLMYDTHSFSVIKYNHFYSSIKIAS